MHESFLPRSRLKIDKHKGAFYYIVLTTLFDNVWRSEGMCLYSRLHYLESPHFLSRIRIDFRARPM